MMQTVPTLPTIRTLLPEIIHQRLSMELSGTRKVAEAYLKYLYSPEGQEIAAKDGYRPRDAAVAAKYAGKFPQLSMFTVDEAFGGWQKAQATHFADGGTFDQIYAPGR